jgi:uncharacterized DUF497 family protein
LCDGVRVSQFRIYSIAFEWDSDKAARNAAKHGVTFAEAATVFLDAAAIDGPDLMHSASESRRRRLAQSAVGRLLMVVYTKRSRHDGESIRLISARSASRRERAAYATSD